MIKKFLIISSLIAFASVFGQKTHVVVQGDTTYNISKKYGMSLADLEKLNPNSKDGKIAIGDVLLINKSGNKHEYLRGFLL